MNSNDIIWGLLGLIELAKQANTLCQVEIVTIMKDEEVTLLHQALKNKHRDIELLYFPNLLTIRIFAS